MELVITFILVVLHQIIQLQCKPLSEVLTKDKTIVSEDYADIDVILTNINKEIVKNIGLRTNLKDGKSVLHMIQSIQKDGSKAPIAIILTPADLEAKIDNKYNLININENKDNNRTENRIILNEIISRNMNSQNDIYNVQETFALDNGIKNVVSLEISSKEHGSGAESSNILRNNLDEITKEEYTNAENIFESKLSFDGDEYDALSESTEDESFKNIEKLAIEDLSDYYLEKQGKYQDHDHHLDNNEQNIKNEANKYETAAILPNKSDEVTNDYFSFGGTNDSLTSDEGVISSRSTLTENQDDKQQNITFADTLFENISKTDNLRPEANKNGYVTSFGTDNNEEINTRCEIYPRKYTKENASNLDKRVYNLAFFFSR